MFPEYLAYLFFIDICQLEEQTFAQFEQREPGYGQAILESYSFAFNSKLEGEISPAFIKSIHAKATRHFPPMENEPGNYRNAPDGGYLLALGGKGRRIHPSLTIDGVKEFINTWLIKPKKPIHALRFTDSHQKEHYIMRNSAGDLYFTSSAKTVVFNPTAENISNILAGDYHMILACVLPTDLLSEMGHQNCDDKYIRQLVEQYMADLCQQYNEEIKQCHGDAAKVRIIVKYVQLIEQLHPFDDGNGRTFYILLNRLLHENGLPLTILSDMNRFDMFSLDELIAMVCKGQVNYLALCNNREPAFDDKYMPIPVPQEILGVNFPDAYKVNNFMEKVIGSNLAILQNSTIDPTANNKTEEKLDELFSETDKKISSNVIFESPAVIFQKLNNQVNKISAALKKAPNFMFYQQMPYRINSLKEKLIFSLKKLDPSERNKCMKLGGKIIKIIQDLGNHFSKKEDYISVILLYECYLELISEGVSKYQKNGVLQEDKITEEKLEIYYNLLFAYYNTKQYTAAILTAQSALRRGECFGISQAEEIEFYTKIIRNYICSLQDYYSQLYSERKFDEAHKLYNQAAKLISRSQTMAILEAHNQKNEVALLKEFLATTNKKFSNISRPTISLFTETKYKVESEQSSSGKKNSESAMDIISPKEPS